MSHLIAHDPIEAKRLFIISVTTTILIAGFASSVLFLFADWIIHLLGGAVFSDASRVLRYLSALPLLIGLTNVFGVQVMIPMGRTKAFNSILATAGVLALAASFPLVTHYGATGAAAAATSAELLITVLMFMYLRHRNFIQ